MGRITRVECSLKDCAYYHQQPGDDMCECSHPDKPHHMEGDRCPLYRMDWGKSKKKLEELKARFGR